MESAADSPTAQEKMRSLHCTCDFSVSLRLFKNKKNLLKQNIKLTLHPPVLLGQWEGPKTKKKKKIVF